MRIISWNVNGLRSILRKESYKWIISESIDIICLQEIKTRSSQLNRTFFEEFERYKSYWNPASQAGYSGVATLSVSHPMEVQTEFGVKRFDHEGRYVITRFPGFVLFNIYFPNGKRDHARLAYKLDFYEHILGVCVGLLDQGESIILCGDLNTAHNEIDLKNPRQNRKNSGFLPQERAWIDKYLNSGFVDVFRSMYPDRVQYTWWTYRFDARKRNIGWRLDYFLVSEEIIGAINDVVIREEVLGSDHCPIMLDVNEDFLMA